MRLGLDCSRFGSCFFARKDFPSGVRNRMQDKILFRQLRFSLFSSARYFDICLRRFLSKTFTTDPWVVVLKTIYTIASFQAGFI